MPFMQCFPVSPIQLLVQTIITTQCAVADTFFREKASKPLSFSGKLGNSMLLKDYPETPQIFLIPNLSCYDVWTFSSG